MPFTFKLSKRLAHSRGMVVLALAAAFGCAPGERSITAPTGIDSAPVAAITLSPNPVSGTVGQTAQFTAVLKDAAGNTLAGRTIRWSTSNPAVVTITASGLATGTGAGTAQVMATNGAKQGVADVTVTPVPPPPAVPVTTVTVTPASLSDSVGQSTPLTVVLKDAAGNVLTGRSVSWASGNTAVATVNGVGLVTGVAAGSTTITATSEGKSGTAQVTVTGSTPPPPPPPAAAPGTVGDLAVVGANDSSLTLAFTEVTNGAGQPAAYELRVAAGTISWGAATSVARGTCSAPIAGSTIGIRRTCTVLGLTPGTAYQAQIIAYRGTLNVDAVFGQVSNVASGSTTAPAPLPVATVTVAPATASVSVAGSQQFTVVLRDANGAVLTGRSVTWSSSAPLVAGVNGSGLATGLVVGTSSIIAASEGKTGRATLSVTVLPPPPPPPPPSGSWPHEPAGFSTITDNPFDGLTASLWGIYYNASGLVSIVSDPTAPASPSSVVQFQYPAGFAAGVSPGMEAANLGGQKRLYVGLWWKASNPWQGNPTGVNKIQYVFTNSQGSMFMCLYGPDGGPYELRVFPQFTTSLDQWLSPNVNNVAVSLGVWHRLEWLIDYSGSTSRIQWWMDGTLIGDYSGVPMPSEGLIEYHMAPVWGGTLGVKTQTDYFWYDHAHISGN